MRPRSQLPHLFESIAVEAMFGIVVFDPNGQCVFINTMAGQLLGTTTPLLEDLVPKDEKPNLKSFTLDLLKNDGLYQDILVNKPGGGSLIANVGVRLLNVDGYTEHLVMVQDVTLQKKLQREILAKQTEINNTFEELLKQNRQLKQLDVAKDRFIALTTHELRTPLSAMVASAEILKLNLYDSPEQMREFIDMIYEQGHHLQDLVNDILDFAKIQAGKMDFFIGQSDVGPFAESLFHSFESMAATSAVTLHIESVPENLNCYFDEVRLRQVLSNIINNAIKYNKTNGKVHLSLSQEGSVVKISVRDTGKGIPEEEFDKVFNEFETIGKVAQHHKGTGLGMPISRKLMEGMGGTLQFTSVHGEGSTFWIEIPTEKILEESLYRPRPKDPNDLAA